MEENIKINLLNKDNLTEKNYSTISILRVQLEIMNKRKKKLKQKFLFLK